MFPVVVIRQPGHTPIHLQVREAIELGRECSGVILNDPQVSRRHLVLAPTRAGAGEVAVLDLGSMNGTLLDGVRLTAEAVVRPGQEVRLGETTLWLLADTPGGAPRRGAPAPAAEPAVPDEHAATTVLRAQPSTPPAARPAPQPASATPERAWARPRDDTGAFGPAEQADDQPDGPGADTTGEAGPGDPWR